MKRREVSLWIVPLQSLPDRQVTRTSSAPPPVFVFPGQTVSGWKKRNCVERHWLYAFLVKPIFIPFGHGEEEGARLAQQFSLVRFSLCHRRWPPPALRFQALDPYASFSGRSAGPRAPSCRRPRRAPKTGAQGIRKQCPWRILRRLSWGHFSPGSALGGG